MYSLNPIGIIHTPINSLENAPIQSARSSLHGSADIYPAYQEGLEGIDQFSHIYLLYFFDRSESTFAMKVKPFLDDKEHGLFTTRFPCRPNPIGFSVVKVISVVENRINFLGADMLDGTPLLDIKPYIPEFDVFIADKVGWYKTRQFD
jgi:tRNA-Thr(GGU) m(6)t(6)A37 methyltransferase TsaA